MSRITHIGSSSWKIESMSTFVELGRFSTMMSKLNMPIITTLALDTSGACYDNFFFYYINNLDIIANSLI